MFDVIWDLTRKHRLCELLSMLGIIFCDSKNHVLYD
jgi:hypothetical protein